MVSYPNLKQTQQFNRGDRPESASRSRITGHMLFAIPVLGMQMQTSTLSHRLSMQKRYVLLYLKVRVSRFES